MVKTLYLLALGLLFQCASAAAQQPKVIDWNDKELSWLSYEEGLKQLKNTNGVGLMVIYGDFCHICKDYAKLFKRQDVIESLQGIVLIRVDAVAHPEVNERYDLDGGYVPRTFALDSNGNVSPQMHRKRSQFSYVMTFDDPKPLIRFAKNLKFYESEINKVNIVTSKR